MRNRAASVSTCAHPRLYLDVVTTPSILDTNLNIAPRFPVRLGTGPVRPGKPVLRGLRARSIEMDDAALQSYSSCLRSVIDIQLLKEMTYVLLHRGLGNM